MRTDWNGKPYYSLDYYLKETFGTKVYKLALDGGMTCPNRDGTIGTGGCIFCSEGGSGDFAAEYDISISAQIAAAKKKISKKTNCRKFIAYFQNYTNTDIIEFLKRQGLEVKEDIIVYSIVNSLVELNSVNNVQISINGDSNLKYRNEIDLSTPLIRNLDIVESKSEEK